MLWITIACHGDSVGWATGAKTQPQVLNSDLLAQSQTLQRVFSGDTTVGLDATGDPTRLLQQALYDLGRYNSVDGKYGDGTAWQWGPSRKQLASPQPAW